MMSTVNSLSSKKVDGKDDPSFDEGNESPFVLPAIQREEGRKRKRSQSIDGSTTPGKLEQEVREHERCSRMVSQISIKK